MLRIPYADVLRKVEGLWLGTRNDMPVLDASVAQVHLSTWAGQLWEQYFWPEWTLVERRQFRQNWAAATTYGAPTASAAVERYHVRSGKYFQSLRAANTGNAPMDDDGDENSVWWAQCASAYSGDDYEAGDFAVGDIVRNPDDDRFHQCHTPHTGTGTFDSTKFGILTVFKRSIAYEQSWETYPIGRARAVFDNDPEVFWDHAHAIGFTEGTALFVAGEETRVWLQYRQRAPQWTGDVYDAAATYSAGQRVYEPGETSDKDFYKSLTAANTGNALTDTTKWERLDFPWVLRDAAARACYSELLKSDGQPEHAAAEMALALDFARKEFIKISRTASQRQLPVAL